MGKVMKSLGEMELTRTQHRAPTPILHLTILSINPPIAIRTKEITPALLPRSAAVVCSVAAGNEFGAGVEGGVLGEDTYNFPSVPINSMYILFQRLESMRLMGDLPLCA